MIMEKSVLLAEENYTKEIEYQIFISFNHHTPCSIKVVTRILGEATTKCRNKKSSTKAFQMN